MPEQMADAFSMRAVYAEKVCDKIPIHMEPTELQDIAEPTEENPPTPTITSNGWKDNFSHRTKPIGARIETIEIGSAPIMPSVTESIANISGMDQGICLNR